ncbi:hypothetical protein [Francisella marina]|uniref:hypothetical protein n=1 Tax=Francisella marina TaxID=2249302 RepID=UPI0011ED3B8B|nr:hypothetical protein [Francisella marina]QEO58334.1 hypothetical protein F0R75_00555 [Francisella marina]
MNITYSQLRRVKCCHNGIVEFCKNNNIDFDNFVKNGIEEEQIKNIKDSHMRLYISKVKKRFN